MKKITLMLCACAMAFAGLLVSCSNGSEKIIFTDTKSYDYAYTLSGTKVTTQQTATDKAVLLTTVTTTESFASSAILTYEENDNQSYDFKNYKLQAKACKANKVVKTAYTGTSASSAPAVADTFTDYYDFYGTNRNFYKLGDKYYNGSASAGIDKDDNGYPVYGYNTYTEEEEEDLDPVVTVTGDIENDDKITIVYTYTTDTSAGDAVNKTVTVYTYNLVKAGTED